MHGGGEGRGGRGKGEVHRGGEGGEWRGKAYGGGGGEQVNEIKIR